MGFHLPLNFNVPYRATSITDFWHRWHISLSTWLRDYPYIPLGGNRKGKVRTYVNLLLTMVLGGLWHGASWNFVFWGALHGAALALDKLRLTIFSKRSASARDANSLATSASAVLSASNTASSDPSRSAPVKKTYLLVKALGLIFTFNFVSFAWIFFRSRTFADAWTMIGRIFSQFNAPILLLWIQKNQLVGWLVLLGYLSHWIPKRFELGFEKGLRRAPLLLQSLFLAVVIWILLQARSADIQPFIYFKVSHLSYT